MVRTLKIKPLPSLFRVISDCDCSQNDHKISENPRLPTSYVLMASVNENEGISKCQCKVYKSPQQSALFLDYCDRIMVSEGQADKVYLFVLEL